MVIFTLLSKITNKFTLDLNCPGLASTHQTRPETRPRLIIFFFLERVKLPTWYFDTFYFCVCEGIYIKLVNWMEWKWWCFWCFGLECKTTRWLKEGEEYQKKNTWGWWWYLIAHEGGRMMIMIRWGHKAITIHTVHFVYSLDYDDDAFIHVINIIFLFFSIFSLSLFFPLQS